MGGASSTEIGGVRVFKITPGSPASEAGLEVYFDFILQVSGAHMDASSHQTFGQKISECENGQAKLVVYNARVNTTREVTVIPRKWGGTGLLGATVRFDTTEPGDTNGIRVLEVFPNSPAAHAGLVPFQDFLLGTTQCAFGEIDELVESVSASINKPMQVYVYNADSETVREVTLVPNNDWGGEGCIGCDIGTGLLHRIPPPRRQPGTAPSPQFCAVPPAVAAVPPPVAGVLPSVGAFIGTASAPVAGSTAVSPALPAGVAAAPAVGGYGVPAAPTAAFGNGNFPSTATPARNPSMMKTTPEATGVPGVLPAVSPAVNLASNVAMSQPAPVVGATPALPTGTPSPVGDAQIPRGVAGVSWPPPRNSQQDVAPSSDQVSGLSATNASAGVSAPMTQPYMAQHVPVLPAGMPPTAMPPPPMTGTAAVL
eukprot:TRINITY_DN2937_c0_g2_i1.p1 TRINITY_DN2937_c0_g2~~TRINITY_DN2937_c0_g2_i1.p1  ORF type:complete len:455 (-),score=67.04 TRINITY_DN2937_c0_g2_i1:141-1418(-)